MEREEILTVLTSGLFNRQAYTCKFKQKIIGLNKISKKIFFNLFYLERCQINYNTWRYQLDKPYE